MAVRDRMTPSHQSVEHVRAVVREAQSRSGLAPPVTEFNEEADDYMDNDLTVRAQALASSLQPRAFVVTWSTS